MTTSTRQQTGISVTELLVTLAVLGLLLAAAVPSFSAMVQRQRLQGAGESFRSDLNLARMQALGTGRSVRVAFHSEAAGSCYVVYQGPAEACSCAQGGVPQCNANAQLISHQWAPAERGVRIQANVNQLTIDGKRGTVSPTATVRLSTARGAEMAHVVAITGRVRTCGDAGYLSPACRT